MRGDYGGGIPVESPDDSAWEGVRDATELKNPGRRGRAMDISNGIPGQGRPVELPSGGIPGPSGDEDGNAGALPARPVLDTVVILEEGNLLQPRCTWCDMLVPWRALNGRQPDTTQCARGAERKMQQLA